MKHPEPLLVYDGGCGLCSWAVRFVLRHDVAGRFSFAALGSPFADRILGTYGVSPAVDSLVLLERGTAATRSAAVFGVLRRLGGPWHLLRIGELVPTRLADAIYDWVARRRGDLSSRWGLSCELPRGDAAERFLG